MIDPKKIGGCMPRRYTVFGCQDDLLIAKQAATLHVACMLASTMNDCGYKPRIWDRVYHKFVVPV